MSVSNINSDMAGFPGEKILARGPTTAYAPGYPGQKSYDPDNKWIMECIAPNLWVRHATMPAGMTFLYSSDGDANGLFYYLGTNYGASAWTNPNTAGRLTITQTGTSFDAASTIVGRTANQVGTGNVTPSDWTFILPSGLFGIMAYSVQSPSPANGSNPTGWQLQCSNDGTNWVTIDTLLTGWNGTQNGVWVTKYVDAQGKAYSQFRLHMHVPNFAAANSFFLLSEVELYGIYYK